MKDALMERIKAGQGIPRIGESIYSVNRDNKSSAFEIRYDEASKCYTLIKCGTPLGMGPYHTLRGAEKAMREWIRKDKAKCYSVFYDEDGIKM